MAVRAVQPEPDDLWRLTMEHSPVGMAIVSLAGRIVTTNAALCEMLGVEVETLRSTPFQDLTHPDDLADDLRPIHFIAQVADRTETVRAIRAKDDFVSHVSHELRTPLTSALAHLELLEDSGDLGQRAAGHVTAVRRNVVRLSHFVADVLFASRASAGCTLVDPYRVDVVTVVADALDAARVEAAIAGVVLEADLPDSLVAWVDGLWLRQVVDNLIGNATAYVPRHGHVVVALRATADEVVLVVEDDGEGIEAADLPQVCDPFFRGENARSRQVPGVGLGLHIVATIAEAHGGTATAASQRGHGTTVRVALPR